jgi:hypothetical protein
MVHSVGLTMEKEKENHKMMEKSKKPPNGRVRVPRISKGLRTEGYME